MYELPIMYVLKKPICLSIYYFLYCSINESMVLKDSKVSYFNLDISRESPKYMINYILVT